MKKISKTITIISIIFSIFLLSGFSISKNGVIDSLFTNQNLLLSIFFFFLFTTIFYFLILFFYHLLDKIKQKEINSKMYNLIFLKWPFIIPFIIFFLFGLPILVFYYPGTVQWDGMKQLDYFYNIIPWSNHHPVFPTILMGISMKIGRVINDNFGIFIYTFSQYIISCAVFAYAISFLTKIKTAKIITIATFLFFLLNPLLYINAYTLVKDTLFYLIFILYFIQIIKYYYDSSKKNKIMLLIFSLLLILLRNNGIYITLFTNFIFILFNKNNKKSYIYFCLFLCFFQIFYSTTITLCHVRQGNIREMLSIPIQQTARYVSSYKVTNEEKETIEKIFHMDLNQIKDKYEPELSDPIKFHFSVQNKEELLEYFKIWYKQFKKQPKIYVDSFLENYYGYFYPLKKEYKDGLAQFKIVKNKRVNTGYFNIYQLEKYSSIRLKIENTINDIRNIPVIEMIFNTGFYTWLLLLFIGYSIYKGNKKNILFATPFIITLAFCFLSPVNAYVRYMNPIIYCLPIYIAMTLKLE